MPKFKPWLLALLFLPGCGPYFINSPEQRQRVNTTVQAESYLKAGTTKPSENPADAVSDHDGYFVGLAISGGGLRSANFGAACMFQLQNAGILQRVDCISAVSGGSLPATLYCCLPDEHWNPAFLRDRLSRPYVSNLVVSVLLPWNFIAVKFGNLTATDLLAGQFDNTLFQRNGRSMTFSDLRADRPKLMVNATDLASGEPFIFDNSNFDRLNSDLAGYPLAYAVTASSCVPILMDPVPMRDYNFNDPTYHLLVDGAVYDNLGVTNLLASYEARRHDNPKLYPRGAILIIVDSTVPVGGKVRNRPFLRGTENTLVGLDVATGVLLNRASSAALADIVVQQAKPQYTADQLRACVDQVEHQGYTEFEDQNHLAIRLIHLSISQVADLDTPKFCDVLNSIGTSYNIAPEAVTDLYRAADVLFRKRFDALLKPIIQEIDQYNTQK